MAVGGFIISIDINFQGVPYAFPFTSFIWLSAIFLFSLWGLYNLTVRFLFSNALMWIHIVFSISCFIFIFLSTYLSNYSKSGLAGMPRRYFDYSDLSFLDLFSFFSPPIKIALLSLVIGQLLYLSNLIIGLSKRTAASDKSR